MRVRGGVSLETATTLRAGLIGSHLRRPRRRLRLPDLEDGVNQTCDRDKGAGDSNHVAPKVGKQDRGSERLPTSRPGRAVTSALGPTHLRLPHRFPGGKASATNAAAVV